MPKAKKSSSIRSTPYGVMSSEDTSEDKLAQFLTSDRSRRRSAVVDQDDSFSTAISLPLNLKCLTTTDADSNPDASPKLATTDTDSSAEQAGSESEDALQAKKELASGLSESHDEKCAKSGGNTKESSLSPPEDDKDGAATHDK